MLLKRPFHPKHIRNWICILLGIIVFCFTSCKTKNSETDKLSQPNIIFIMADDLGYGDVGCYGQQIIKTPNIDGLAAEGILFTQHYAGNTVCAPSRCALMTGLHMGHAAIRGNAQAEKTTGQWPLPADAVTIANLLQKAGYVNGMIGKWGLGNEGTSGDPLKKGFDFYYGYLDQVLAHNYYPEFLVRNGKREYLKNEVVYQDSTAWHKGLGSHSTHQTEYSNDFFTEEALSFIDQKKDTTFFLYLPYTIPHDNGEAPKGERMEVPDKGIYEKEDWPNDTKGYASMISRLDSYIGQIMQKLKEAGIDNNTIVFFTSDNGPMPGEEFTEFFNSNGELKGGKRDLYEGGIRVPMIVRWPNTIEAGRTSKHISAFWDFLPTACELAGIDTPKDIDGISFLPELLNQEQESHNYLYWEFTEKGGKQAIRKGIWKAVRNNVFKSPSSTVELYDLSTDLGEKTDLAGTYPEIAADLDSLIKTARIHSEKFILYPELGE